MVSAWLTTLACVGPVTGAVAGTPRAVFTDRSDSPTSVVPGLGTYRFGPVTWASLAHSPDGRWWVLDAFLDAPSDRDEVLIRGLSAAPSAAKVFAREGDPSFALGRTYEGLSAQVGITDGGTVAFAGDLTGDPSSDQFVAVWPDAAADPWADGVTPVAWEGQLIPWAGPFGAGARWDKVDSPVVVRAAPGAGELGGVGVGLRMFGVQGVSTLADRAIEINGVVLARKDVTVPMGQAGARPWANFTADTLRASADGAHWMACGSLAGAASTAAVCAVDNVVVAQQGQTIGPTRVEAVRWPDMAPDGRWAFIADMSDSGAIVFASEGRPGPGVGGRVLAGTGSAIVPGSDEVFDNSWYFGTFFGLALNTLGDAVVGGITDAPIGSSAVLVLYARDGSARVVLREGDAIDIDGDGLADPDAFIDGWLEGSGGRGIFLTDAGTLVMLVSIRNHRLPGEGGPDGTIINQGLVVYQIPGWPLPCPCVADFDGSGGTPDGADVSAFFAAWLAGDASADVDCSGATPDASDLVRFFDQWLAGGC